jgi:hypothetical protein
VVPRFEQPFIPAKRGWSIYQTTLDGKRTRVAYSKSLDRAISYAAARLPMTPDEVACLVEKGVVWIGGDDRSRNALNFEQKQLRYKGEEAEWDLPLSGSST